MQQEAREQLPDLPDLPERNRRCIRSLDAAAASRSAPPARKIAVLTCMDARMDPRGPLDLELGDPRVLRNAGGRASADALRSLTVSTQLLGTRLLPGIHHTDFGMLGLDDDLRARLERETGADASGMTFLGFDDLRQSARDDVRRVRE